MAKGFRGGMGMGGNMNQVVAQAQKMQRQIEMAQAEIQEMRFTGTAGGELVKVVVTGKHQLESVEIAKEVVDPEDIEGLQDLIIAAANQALEQIDKTNQERIGAITGGMKLPF
ncbi:MAG: YbaB/EbfC family nucleoid-associated protein [Eubacteriales bacterium]|jgi:DNA-binding YbaB/EbfC family protein|nr:YbaB/EbfC family nucleoid-associated protein [Clostridiales bacterium]MBQ1294049.1 YbaB/EbfC family nucleoid-associated protein [Clostridiales bacterium]MBQ1575119.1 YbaB/EbfC family nucleoid-associated protein [Clostridiales bacterium]MBR2598902.1 YbaB/EbfC family nucleoid-associated protein [Clostridiales bacterium]MDO4421466.1 YbaB/EbfC family nucleoid-associated protein [Eubacteriales bacterium]